MFLTLEVLHGLSNYYPRKSFLLCVIYCSSINLAVKVGGHILNCKGRKREMYFPTSVLPQISNTCIYCPHLLATEGYHMSGPPRQVLFFQMKCCQITKDFWQPTSEV